MAVTLTLVPIECSRPPVPGQGLGALALGPYTLKLIEPPGAGEVVAPARVAEGVRAVLTTEFDASEVEMVGSASTMALDDSLLVAPTQLVPIVGVSVYCHVPNPGTSVQVTVPEVIEQLPLMAVGDPTPAPAT